ncbi:MAG TPA: DinB family protein [Ktedonobacteraceae bacterium]|nr:DinB family protein [Ktedonobacteraceae bacterium]
MSETGEVLAFFREGWQNYQDHLSKALAPLSAEQLALRAAPGLRSIEQLARHLIATRAGWFRYVLKEGGEELHVFDEWYKQESLPRSAEDLVSGLATTWQVIEEVLGRYTLSDLQSLVQDEDEEGKVYDLTRGWVLWHVLEHDLHHGGEIGYSLGMHGLAAPNL